jgi:hypothetical protein
VFRDWRAARKIATGLLKERAMRAEIFVRPDGNAWEVDAVHAGYLQSHATSAAALRQAREVARVTWVEGHKPSTVKVLGPEGWMVDAYFGLEGLGD